jgi:hypothetical protein
MMGDQLCLRSETSSFSLPVSAIDNSPFYFPEQTKSSMIGARLKKTEKQAVRINQGSAFVRKRTVFVHKRTAS